MKNDASSLKFKSIDHFYTVLQQQGRVFLDSDWNEQAEIIAHRNETEVSDIIGDNGAPMDGAGFQVGASAPLSPPSRDITISKGHFYVGGILCENENDVLFENQADYPLASLPSIPGNYLFFLDVWLFHATALEKSSILEVALGGPDTTTRSKVIWQVKYAQVASNTCSAVNLPDETAVSTGKLAARSEQTKNSDNPCDLTVTGGYRGLQNQLYRVEIHKGGTRAKATFKWAKNNASIAAAWLKLDNQNELTVSSLGKDGLLGFSAGHWIELIDESTDLLNKPGILAKISKPPQNNVITIDLGSVIFPDATVTSVSFNNALNPRIRRWDSAGQVALNTANSTWLDLEDGVQVNFQDGTFHTGDYWVIPARTAIADIEWQRDNASNPIPLLPFGIYHHYAKLAILNLDAKNGWTVVSDCRNLFPSLTELTALYYVGGDGQKAAPGKQLPFPLIAGVANGGIAVQNKKVLFEILPGPNLPAVIAGSLTYAGNGGPLSGTSVIATTDENGMAMCTWTIDTNTSNSDLQVKASLLDDAGNVIAHKLPVIFTANFETANATSKCSYSVGKGGDFETIEEAISKTNDQKSVCLCILPQPNPIKIGGIRVRGKEFFKITGCGAQIEIAEGEILIQAVTIVLHGLNIQAIHGFSTIILQANDTYVDYCNFTCSDNNNYMTTPFISIIPSETTLKDKNSVALLWWKNNQLFVGKKSNGIGLALTQQVGGWIENSLIKGTLVLQYSRNLEWTADILKEIQTMIGKNVIGFVGHLQIRSNTINNIFTNGAGFIENKTIVSQSIIVSENVFVKTDLKNISSSFNNFIAQFLNLINNHFIDPKNRNEVDLVGMQGVVMGNIAANDNTSIQMHTTKSIGLVPPKLNLVPVT